MKTKLTALALSVFLCLSSTIGQTEIDVKTKNKMHKEFTKNFSNYIYIPSGTIAESEYSEKKVALKKFRIYNAEITNDEWKYFITGISKDISKDSVLKLLPDTTLWTTYFPSYGSTKDYYYSHPAYAKYPVTNVSREQIDVFCKWVTQEINKSEKCPYKEVKVRLPKEHEWMYAAGGMLTNAVFPWGSTDVYDTEGKMKANFLPINQYNIKRDSLTGKLSFTEYPKRMIGDREHYKELVNMTVHVLEFKPNDYGLYNMAGNVAEFVEEEGITKGGSFDDPAYYLNIYKRQYYQAGKSAHPTRGFRILLEIIEY
ncbi:MAG: SUMF1/EgtB/PvdO family nonheme iron enzyme [Crocinitomicaceae bacterium]|nr:SUMF1/EgtB/PvdO family nonheme iron enzyme [Crocinitomicaceae bacterium]